MSNGAGRSKLAVIDTIAAVYFTLDNRRPVTSTTEQTQHPCHEYPPEAVRGLDASSRCCLALDDDMMPRGSKIRACFIVNFCSTIYVLCPSKSMLDWPPRSHSFREDHCSVNMLGTLLCVAGGCRSSNYIGSAYHRPPMRQRPEFILALGNINPLTLSLSLPSTCEPH